ncbi:MAG TPA: hypothetical protein VKR06_40515 [Ktedonosporobacter sp.]|nr:hypothetical protein [Ktedonosporobacter sp.]
MANSTEFIVLKAALERALKQQPVGKTRADLQQTFLALGMNEKRELTVWLANIAQGGDGAWPTTDHRSIAVYLLLQLSTD